MVEKWVSPKDAAAALNVSVWVIRRLMKEGRLEWVKLGHRTIRIRMAVEAPQGVADGQVQGQGQEAVGPDDV